MSNNANITSTFECRACHKQFVREQAFLKHECKQLKREKELKSPLGQTAWQYYQLWMRQKKRVVPSIQNFQSSRLFRTFMNFAIFVKKVQLPTPEKFIWYMVHRKFEPTIWTNDTIYNQYMTFIETNIPPLEQAKQSILTILNYADNNNIDPSEVLEHLGPNGLIHLIQIKKLSPWLLLFSKQFKQILVSLTSEQQQILETIIQPDKWQARKAKYPTEIAQIKVYVCELGI